MTILGMVAIIWAVWRILAILERVRLPRDGDHPKNSDHHKGCYHPRDSCCLRDFYHPKGWLLNFGYIES